MITLIIFLSIAMLLSALFAVIFYTLYVKIIKNRNKVHEALSGIDVQLKQRSSLIPNVLTLARKFMDHEMSVFTEVTKLRENLDKGYDQSKPAEVSEHLRIANELSGKLSQLKMTLENYPQIKSDATMIQAMQTSNEIDAKIAASRRFYNSSVTELNNSVQIFPGSVVAQIIHVSSMPFFETDVTSKTEINAADYM